MRKTHSYTEVASYVRSTNGASPTTAGSQSSIPSHLKLVVKYNLPVGLVTEEGREFVAQVHFFVTILGLKELGAFFVSFCFEKPLSAVDLVTRLHAVTKEAPDWSTSAPGWSAAFPVLTCTAAVLRGRGRRRNLHSNADRVARSPRRLA